MEKEKFEKLSELEHDQWMYLTKIYAKWLKEIKTLLKTHQSYKAIKKIKSKLDGWKENWKPYSELDEEIKELDREWARKVEKIAEEA